VGAQALEMKRDRLTDLALNLLEAVAGHSQTRQLRGIGAIAGLALLDDDRVPDHYLDPFNRACRRMLSSVPGGTSVLGFPGHRYRTRFGGGPNVCQNAYRTPQHPQWRVEGCFC
jgi:hypothetical protein